jgi:hypothetical protein
LLGYEHRKSNMTSLGEAFTRLQAALEPLGIEIGREVLDVWLDRARYGGQPIPATALKALAEVIDQLLLDSVGG